MSSSHLRRVATAALLTAIAPMTLACIVWVSKGSRLETLDKNDMPVTVTSAVRAHLADGSTVIYREGLVTSAGRLIPRGPATRYSPTLTVMQGTTVLLDSVLGMEVYGPRTDAVTSTLGTIVGNVGVAALSAVAAVAIFGSCPTIYADSAGTPVLQAEVFATRVSPLLEARDIDLLTATPDGSGQLTLEVRNEALETHYINHFELLEIRHPAGVRLIPDEHGRPLLVQRFAPISAARDRRGRDVTDLLAKDDDVVFRSDSATLRHASGADPYDYIDFSVPRPVGDSAVVGLGLRNSLLNTVLLYEMMLANPGARSIDWLAKDMTRIGPMLKFGRWYREHFGLRVYVRDGERWREIERHPTYGPVAWREAATVVPVLEQDSLRVRLRFAADEWRIDWVGVAPAFARPRPRILPISSVRTTNDSIARLTQRNLRAADDRYVETGPGERFWVTFATGPAPLDSARSFLLASQGYYSEWIRGSWVKNASDSTKFSPSADALDRTFQRWSAQRDSLDRAFYSTRIPVRTP